ncbi:CbrC family protein [Luteimonas sp. A537]
MSLPSFPYHPNPIATGAIRSGPEVCVCCELARGYIYVGPVYSIKELGSSLCPWCIADGTAARRFSASFSDSWSFSDVGLPVSVTDEVEHKTPGYDSWQGENWLQHCSDICEFHGDATVQDIQAAADEGRVQDIPDFNVSPTEWSRILEHYKPKGDPSFYKFVCRHCQAVLFAWDCS